MNILFYTLASKRSRDIESQAIEFAKRGHSIFLLTQSDHSILHDNFNDRGFVTAFRATSEKSFPGWLLSELFHLSRFCRRHKIDLVYSHLEPCNLIASLCQYLNPRVSFILYRHHADALEFESNKKGRWLTRQVYKLAPRVIAVSDNAKAYMVKKEGINPGKITVIPLAFNFDLYELPSEEEVLQIRSRYKCDLLVCTVGRLTSLKRIDSLIKVISLAKSRQIDVELLVLGDGEELNYLKDVALAEGVESNIYFLGFIDNVLPYMAAADVYIHLSKSEASCTVVKEAALISTPVIVCEGVGDFNDYIEHGINGWLLERNNYILQAAEILVAIYNRKYNVAEIGRNLNKKVRSHFDIANVIDCYTIFHTR